MQRSRREASLAIEEEILRSIRRIVRALDLYSRKLVLNYGLSGPQLSCLRLLDLHGPMQSGELATAMGLSPATVTGIVDRLEARELVRRERQVDDKRCVVVRLSRQGADVVHDAPPLLQDSVLTEVRALPPSEQQDLNRSLRKLDALMTAAGAGAEPDPEPSASGRSSRGETDTYRG